MRNIEIIKQLDYFVKKLDSKTHQRTKSKLKRGLEISSWVNYLNERFPWYGIKTISHILTSTRSFLSYSCFIFILISRAVTSHPQKSHLIIDFVESLTPWLILPQLLLYRLLHTFYLFPFNITLDHSPFKLKPRVTPFMCSSNRLFLRILTTNTNNNNIISQITRHFVKALRDLPSLAIMRRRPQLFCIKLHP